MVNGVPFSKLALEGVGDCLHADCNDAKYKVVLLDGTAKQLGDAHAGYEDTQGHIGEPQRNLWEALKDIGLRCVCWCKVMKGTLHNIFIIVIYMIKQGSDNNIFAYICVVVCVMCVHYLQARAREARKWDGGEPPQESQA